MNKSTYTIMSPIPEKSWDMWIDSDQKVTSPNTTLNFEESQKNLYLQNPCTAKATPYEPLKVEIEYSLPTGLRHSVVGMTKTVLDALEGALYEDDCAISVLEIKKSKGLESTKITTEELTPKTYCESLLDTIRDPEIRIDIEDVYAAPYTGHKIDTTTKQRIIEKEPPKCRALIEIIREKIGDREISGAIELEINIRKAVNKTWQKSLKEAAITGDYQVTCKPDCDNVLKTVSESLIGGVIASEDMIYRAKITKQYAEKDGMTLKIKKYRKEN